MLRVFVPSYGVSTTVWIRGWAGSAEVTAQHQGGGAALIVAVAASHFGKAGPGVKPPRRGVAFVDFEEDRADRPPRQGAEMKVEQRPRQPAAAPRWGNCNRQNFSFVGSHARHDETNQRTPDHGAVSDHGAVCQKTGDLVF